MNGTSETILHLLTASKADSTVMNNVGKTALDHAVSLSSFFLMAGATVTLSAYGATFSPQLQDKMKNWEDEMTKWIDKTSKNLIVVSVLIATVAFAAAFNVPGSYNSEGEANLRRTKGYKIFLVLDSIAMSASVSATVLLVVAKAVYKSGSWYSFYIALLFLLVSLFSMELAFHVAMSEVSGGVKYVIKYIIWSIFYLTFLWPVIIIYIYGSPAKMGTIIKFLSSPRKEATSKVTVQLQNVESYVKGTLLFIFLNSALYIILIAAVFQIM